MRISIVVPCCNEEEALQLLPQRLFPVLFLLALRDQHEVELVLVDDGSQDATWEMLETLREQTVPFTIVLGRHTENRGLGAALRTGTNLASGEIIVTMDADGTYPFGMTEALVASVLAGADVVTASPYHPKGTVEGVEGIRLLLSKGASLLYRILVDRRIHTYTAMVRAYRAETLRAALPEDDGFLHVARCLVEARRRGAHIVELPATLSRRQVGASKAKLVRTTRTHLSYMLRLLGLRLSRRFWIGPDTHSQSQREEAISHG